ncbi:MAG: DJ-1/PfpI family protein, partial [Candidatus Aminicenantes bacterium]|nr:DJ-1/PfpI family protein [Candidatus Aminicenantes bacterium]
WVMKRIGIENDYRGCYNKDRSIALSSDILIQDLKDFSGYDSLIIPSGPQFRKFQENPAVLQFIRDAHDAGVLIASFCVGNYLVKESGLLDSSEVIELFPKKVTMVGEGILLGPRGGGPPPGDGFKSAPIEEICDAIAREIKNRKGKEAILP